MARCDCCGTMILFGAVREGDLRYSNRNCYEQGYLGAIANQLPELELLEYLRQIHEGKCPKCNGSGPVDMHTSHIVWSLVYLSIWRSRPEVCCRRCGIKARFGGTVFSFLLGWWSIIGVFLTPIQICRNLYGLFRLPDPAHPSPALEEFVRQQMAANAASTPPQPVGTASELHDEAIAR